MIDTFKNQDVQISKQDIAGKEIAGAHLNVYDSAGRVRDDWWSEENKSHAVKGLEPGQYVLQEITAPDGYQKAESIHFTVLPNGKVSVGNK